MECFLNDCLIHSFAGSKHLDPQLDGYLSMSLKGKLINVVPIITAQRFVINQEHKTYQHLAELIKIRNRLVHNRSTLLEEQTATLTTTEDGKPFLTFSGDRDLDLDGLRAREKERDYTFGVPGDVGRFHDALDDFFHKFFAQWDEDEFKANDLIVEAEKLHRLSISIKDE
jgi:hypothetical protein